MAAAEKEIMKGRRKRPIASINDWYRRQGDPIQERDRVRRARELTDESIRLLTEAIQMREAARKYYQEATAIHLAAQEHAATERPQARQIDPDLERTFRTLADEWLDETSHLSNPVDKFMHPALVQIIGLGKQAVPLILQEVRKMSGHWFYALEHINRTNPVPPEDQWDIERTAAAWLHWGQREGLIG